MAERENLPVPENPDFNLEIGGLQPDDPVHFGQMNDILARLLTNDAFLEKLAGKMVEKALIAHVLDSTNPSMVLGADQAPALTRLLDVERQRIAELYSNLTCEVTGAEISDFNKPTRVINGYTSTVSNAPNGYQTGGKVISVCLGPNDPLMAQLAISRAYPHPQYRVSNGLWNDLLLSSDLKIKVLDVVCNIGKTKDNRLNAYNHIVTGMASVNNNDFITSYLLIHDSLCIVSNGAHTVRVYYIELPK